MNLTDEQIEQEIQAKELTAPRVTPEQIENVIVDEMYYVFPNTTLTVCCLVLANGFNVTGESACVSSVNFDAEIGRKIAKQQATQKIWQLEGYALAERLNVK